MTSIIRMPEVERRTGQRAATIYKLMQAGQFPRTVRVGRRAVGWIEEEIDKYVEAKIAERDKTASE